MFQSRASRRRFRRSRRAQVSAIAVTLTLLLIVSYIANFLANDLPSQMAALENKHVLQIENQLARLDATILMMINSGVTYFPLSGPVTLGSQGAPPFGAPTPSSIVPDTSRVSTTANYSLAHPVLQNITFVPGDPCSGACHPNTYVQYNESLQGGTASLTLNNGGILWNMTGNNTNINLDWKGNTYGNPGTIIVRVNGSFDNLTFLKDGQGNNPNIIFLFYGQHDSWAGSANGQNTLNATVTFISSDKSGVCPVANLTSTDTFGGAAGNPNWHINVTWWNNVGWVTPKHVIVDPSGDILQFQNRSGSVACAFDRVYVSNYASVSGGGVLVHVANRYSPQYDIALDEGALVQGQGPSGIPIMIDPPPIVVTTTAQGIQVAATLFNFVGDPRVDSGTTDAWVTMHVLHIAQLQVHPGLNRGFVYGFNFTVSTMFPQAWLHFFNSMPDNALGTVQCLPPVPASCTPLASGTVATLEAPLLVANLVLTIVTLEISIN